MAWGENEIAMRETDAGSSNLQNGHVYELAFSGQRIIKSLLRRCRLSHIELSHEAI